MELMEEETSKTLKRKLGEVNSRLLSKAETFYKYPGSVVLYKRGEVGDYVRAGIEDPEIILKLVEAGICPYVTAGSRSQGQDKYCTNFCLEDYVNCGVKKPEAMLALREQGITPCQLEKIIESSPKKPRMLREIVAIRNKIYGKPKKTIKTKFDSNINNEIQAGVGFGGAVASAVKEWFNGDKE
jgi:hypothetical protein